MMQNSHEIREFVGLLDRIDIMESWTEELENKPLNYSSRMSVINNELTCLALTGCVPLNRLRPSAIGVTQLNSTQLDVELS